MARNDLRSLVIGPIWLGGLILLAALARTTPAQVQLSDELTPTMQMIDYQVDPASGDVIYRAGPGGWARPHERSRLFRVGVEGGTVTALTPDLPTSSGVASYAIAASGPRVIYRADAPTQGHYELFSVPIGPGGGATTQLSATTQGLGVWGVPRPDGADPSPVADSGAGFRLTPGGTTVIFQADGATTGRLDLFSVPAGGGTVVRLNSAGGGWGVMPEGYRIRMESPRVIFAADGETSGVYHLYGAAVDGSTVEKWTADPVMNLTATPRHRHHRYPGFELSPDGHWMAFSSATGSPLGYRLQAMQSNGVGGPPTLLHPALTDGGGSVQTGEGAIQYSPDGERVIFQANVSGLTSLAPVTAARDGSTHVVKAVTTEHWRPWRFTPGPDNSSLVFTNGYRLYGDTLDGTTPTLILDSYCEDEAITPDGQYVVFLAPRHFDQTLGEAPATIMRAPIGGGTPREYTCPAPPFDQLTLTPDGNGAIFMSTDGSAASYLYQLDLESGRFWRLDRPLGQMRGVMLNEMPPMNFSIDGQRVIFIADSDGIYELFSNGLKDPDAAADARWLLVE
jgi:Tol biopolymer transport system component